MLRTIDPIAANRRYPASTTPPTNPIRGYFWSEIDSNGDLVQDWFWNGTYWLSTGIFNTGATSAGGLISGSGETRCPLSIGDNYNLFLIRAFYGFRVFTTNNAVDFWGLDFRRADSAGNRTAFALLSTATYAADTYYLITVLINTHVVSSNVKQIRAGFTKNGAAGSIDIAYNLDYRYARP